jgi:hypothetical protein
MAAGLCEGNGHIQVLEDSSLEIWLYEVYKVGVSSCGITMGG